MKKKCSKCNEELPFDLFWNAKATSDGKQSRCKSCSKAGYERWRQNNYQLALDYNKKWYANNKPRAKELAREFKANNKEHLRQYAKTKRQKDTNYREAVRMRNLLRSAIRSETGISSIWKYVGCSRAEFRRHIEKQFTENMSWENWGQSGWHIDHIKPLSHFDMISEDQKALAFHYSNTRPLWSQENWSKGNRR
jgi:hypothetical protein